MLYCHSKLVRSIHLPIFGKIWIPDMSPVKYQRFLPAATITASLALLSGCIFVATSGASGFGENETPATVALISDSSSTKILSALHEMQADGSNDKRFEVSTHDKFLTLSVFGKDTEDITRAGKFAEAVANNRDFLEEARMFEYDVKAEGKPYEGSMFLRLKNGVSMEDVLKISQDFSGFNTNTVLLTTAPRIQFLEISQGSLVEILNPVQSLSISLQEELGADDFSVVVRIPESEIAILPHTASSGISEAQFKGELGSLQSEVSLPDNWKIVSR